jgi:hypothetical protein
MRKNKRQRKDLETTQKIIDRRKSALLELGKGADNSVSPNDDEKAKKIKNATDKVFDRWDEVFTKLAK